MPLGTCHHHPMEFDSSTIWNSSPGRGRAVPFERGGWMTCSPEHQYMGKQKKKVLLLNISTKKEHKGGEGKGRDGKRRGGVWGRERRTGRFKAL